MKEFRDRVLIPLSIPLLALALIVVIVLNLSRILLALQTRASASVATAVAIVVAAAILCGATYLSARGERRSINNTAVLAASGAVVILGGFIGHAAYEEALEVHNDEDVVLPIGDPHLVFHAIDIDWEEKEAQTPAVPDGVIIQIVNNGLAVHTFLLDEVPAFKLEVASAGATDIGRVELEPGIYNYYCDVPGHRAAGMEGVLTVTEAVAE